MPNASKTTEGRRVSALLPMDLALEYCRDRIGRILGVYLVAMLPFSLIVMSIFDAVSAHHRSVLPALCMLLSVATLWRWAWLGVLQRRVQEDLRGIEPGPLKPRLLAVLIARLLSNALITWGSFLILPAYYGFFLSGLATPALLETEGDAAGKIKTTFAWIHQATARLGRISFALGLLTLVIIIGTVAVQMTLLHTVLPSFLGLDVSELSITMGSYTWTLCVGYFIFLILDAYLAVLSVFLFYDLQERKLGTDLQLQLHQLQKNGS